MAFTEEVRGGARCRVQVAQQLEHLCSIQPDEGCRRPASRSRTRPRAMTRHEQDGGVRVFGERFEHGEGSWHRGVVDNEEVRRRRWSQADPTSRPDGLEVLTYLCFGRPAGGRASAIVELDLEVGYALRGIRPPDGVATAEGQVPIGEREQEVLPWCVLESHEIGLSLIHI